MKISLVVKGSEMDSTNRRSFLTSSAMLVGGYDIEANTRPLLAWMSYIKLGDFILLTPSLKEIQKHYPCVVVAVPDLLWDLYEELEIFERSIPALQAEDFRSSFNVKPVVLDLTYPLLLDRISISDDHLHLDAEVFSELIHSTKAYQKALIFYFPDLSLDFEAIPFIDINPAPKILAKYDLTPFKYFTVHSGSDFQPKNWSPKSFETTIEIILERYPELVCVSLVGPQDHELFELNPMPKNLKIIRTDLRELAHLLAGSLFHVDNDSGVHHLAGAIDVPSITVFGPTGPGTWSSITKRNFIHWGGAHCPNHCGGSKMIECEEKICLTSVKPAFLVESAEKILRAYNHP